MLNDKTVQNPIDKNLDKFGLPASVGVTEGDLLFLVASSANVQKASQVTWDTNLATTQDNAGPQFVGIAARSVPSSNADALADMPVVPAIEKEFDCTSSTFEIGDLVAPADSGSNTLENQKLAKTTSSTAAIGHVVKRYASATTRVRVRLFSRKLPPVR